MLEGLGASASSAAPASASEPPACPVPRRRGAARSSVPQKLAEALSSQYGLNVFVAGLLFLLAWAVHAVGVGKRDLLGLLTALMLLQLLWMLWYVGRSYAQRRLIRPKDAHAGARWLRGECAAAACLSLPRALPFSPEAGCVLLPSSGFLLRSCCSPEVRTRSLLRAPGVLGCRSPNSLR